MEKFRFRNLIYYLLLFCASFESPKLFADDDHGNDLRKSVIAYVDGAEITKSDIKIKPGDTNSILNKRLGLKMKQVIYNETANAFHIKVNDREINEKWKNITNNSGAPIDNGAKIGIQAMLIEDKLNGEIDEEIAEKDSDFSKYIRLTKTSPDSPELQKIVSDFEKKHKATVLDYVRAQRFLWWGARYKKAAIHIVDKNYIDALQYVKP